MKSALFIGDLAKQVGLSAKTIRYYEGLGLLSEPQRTETGYRVYGANDVERLQFIQGAKALGLSLADIKEVLDVWSSGEAPCRHVSRRLDEKLEELDRRIAELTSFRDKLWAFKAEVDAAPRPDNVPCAHIAHAAEGHFEMPEGYQDLPVRGFKH